MKALVTGGTGGIGLAMSDSLAKRGYDLLIVSRKEGSIEELRKKYPDRKIDFASYDLSDEKECFRLLDETRDMISLLIMPVLAILENLLRLILIRKLR